MVVMICIIGHIDRESCATNGARSPKLAAPNLGGRPKTRFAPYVAAYPYVATS